jgi:catechol 2,3-dioxygenase-like lactoylglutathione lyase family enzyme
MVNQPIVNGILEASIYVKSVPESVSFYLRIFGFDLLQPSQERLSESTRLAALGAGDRQVLLLFRRGGTPDTDARGRIHVAFGISRENLGDWERWLQFQNIVIEQRMIWEYGGESLYFRDLDGHLLEVATPGVWPIY